MGFFKRGNIVKLSLVQISCVAIISLSKIFLSLQ